MPFRKASTTSPSSSIFSSFPATFHLLLAEHPPHARRGGCLKQSVLGRDGLDVGGLGALRPFAGLELDLRTLRQRLEAVAGDLRVVDEQILSAVLGLADAVAL